VTARRSVPAAAPEWMVSAWWCRQPRRWDRDFIMGAGSWAPAKRPSSLPDPTAPLAAIPGRWHIPTLPGREPADQPGAAHHGHRPALQLDRGTRVLRPQEEQQQDLDGSHALPQTTALRPRLPTRWSPTPSGTRRRAREGNWENDSDSSAAGSHPHAGSSDQPLPDPPPQPLWLPAERVYLGHWLPDRTRRIDPQHPGGHSRDQRRPVGAPSTTITPSGRASASSAASTCPPRVPPMSRSAARHSMNSIWLVSAEYRPSTTTFQTRL
jgi:hypothetical protein